ncbi:hypothetical protein D3C74_40920 [compost metagenome]
MISLATPPISPYGNVGTVTDKRGALEKGKSAFQLAVLDDRTASLTSVDRAPGLYQLNTHMMFKILINPNYMHNSVQASVQL